MKPKKRSNCPISMSLEIWGDRWTLLIIRDLMFEGKRTYGDFLRSDEKIATNILADRLRKLVKDGIVEQTESADTRSGSAYRLTEKGIDLLPILAEVFLWADKHLDLTDELRTRIQAIKQDKPAFIEGVAQSVRQNGD